MFFPVGLVLWYLFILMLTALAGEMFVHPVLALFSYGWLLLTISWLRS